MRVTIRGEGRTVPPNGRLTLHAIVTGAVGAVLVRWYRNGDTLPGGTGNDIQVDEPGCYTASAHDGAGNDSYSGNYFVLES